MPVRAEQLDGTVARVLPSARAARALAICCQRYEIAPSSALEVIATSPRASPGSLALLQEVLSSAITWEIVIPTGADDSAVTDLPI
jgi:hypothetical protein